ncbi:MAG: hypothetical protein ACF8PN_06720 [Phycisphaerales bacterium]
METAEEAEPRSARPSTWLLVAGVVGATTALIAILLWIWWPETDQFMSEIGQVGDFWGSMIAAAISAMSAVLFFGALIMQRRELQIQRQELIATREVAAEQARALAEQQDELEEQNRLQRQRDMIQLVFGAREVCYDLWNRQQKFDMIVAATSISIAEYSLVDEDHSLRVLRLFRSSVPYMDAHRFWSTVREHSSGRGSPAWNEAMKEPDLE